MIAADVIEKATDLQRQGAFGFGLVLGWYLYFLNRYRKDVTLADLTTVIGALGGGAVLALFPAKTDLFGAYGVGLALGFFGYLLVVIVLVGVSKNFDVDFLLDGRCTLPDGTKGYPSAERGGGRPMARASSPLPPGA